MMTNATNVTTMSVSDVIDFDYKPFSMYVVENRAIPSVIDGLKPVSRKVLYSMINNFGGKKTKIAEIGGSLASCNYHHGEGSAMGAAITLAATWQNNVPIFTQSGNFGTRLVPHPSAPRYIFASLSKDFKKYFTDFEVCSPHSDKDNFEPQCYLPVIPWVLVNGIEGIAVGFACKIAPHDPKNLAKACIQYLNGRKINTDLLMPKFPGFEGTVARCDAGDESKVKLDGIIERTKRNTWRITEVPFGVDRDTYFNHLCKMEDEGKIEDFQDNSKSSFDLVVKLNGVQDAECAKDPIAYFKLSKIYSENYSTLDEFGKLKLFSNKSEIIAYFCDYRLKKVKEYLDFEIAKISVNIKFLEDKKLFIDAVVSGKIDIKSHTKASLTDAAIKLGVSEDNSEKVISLPVFSLTSDESKKLYETIVKAKSDRQVLQDTDEKDLFISRLKAI